MCGLSALFRIDGGPIDPRAMDRMLDAMAVRGPDARGIWVQGSVAFGHVRLAIVDLDSRSNQPLQDERGRTVLFNGEIYNHASLRKQLEDGWNFRTAGDTEVILAAFDRWGTDCFRRFNGDWAIVVHDAATGNLVVSRDRFGIKPLYIARHGDTIRLASTVRALLAGGHPSRISAATVRSMVLRGRTDPGKGAHVDGVDTIEPGTVATIDCAGRIRSTSYWNDEDLFGTEVPSGYGEAVEAFGALLDDSTRLRMLADVPVGVCLSGGLDSSLITALASVQSSGPIRTFTGVAPGWGCDESEFATTLIDSSGALGTMVPLDLAGFLSGLPRTVEAQESVLGGPDTVARHVVLQRASRDVKVVLDGQGGDELLAGYRRMHRLYRRMEGGEHLEMEDEIGGGGSDVPPLEELVSSLRCGPVSRSSVPSADRPLDPVTRSQYEALRGTGLRSLLHTEDRLTMAWSMEGRVPFMDHRLVSFCFSAPLRFRIGREDKRLARDFARRRTSMPAVIPDRRDKRGFSSPFGELMRTPEAVASLLELADAAAERRGPRGPILDRETMLRLFDEHRSGGADHANRLIRGLTTAMFLADIDAEIVE